MIIHPHHIHKKNAANRKKRYKIAHFFYRVASEARHEKKSALESKREIGRPQATDRAKRGKKRVAGDAAKGTAREREAMQTIGQMAQVRVRETQASSNEKAKRSEANRIKSRRRLDERKRPPNKQGALNAESGQSSADERKVVTG